MSAAATLLSGIKGAVEGFVERLLIFFNVRVNIIASG
jgi:hypothetical protein